MLTTGIGRYGKGLTEEALYVLSMVFSVRMLLSRLSTVLPCGYYARSILFFKKEIGK